MKRFVKALLWLVWLLSPHNRVEAQLTVVNPGSCSACDGKIIITDFQKVFTNGGAFCNLYGQVPLTYQMLLDGVTVATFNGTFVPSAQSFTQNNVCIGTHTMVYQASPGNCCGCIGQYVITVEVSGLSAGPDVKICGNQNTAKLQGKICGSGYNYNWSPSVGLSDATNLTPYVYAPGSYTLTATKGSNVITDEANVATDPVSVFSYTVSGNNLSLAMSDLACSNIGFVWDYGNGSLNTTALNPSTSYANSGLYTVCLKCLGNPNCVSCVNLNFPGNTSGTVPLGITTGSFSASSFEIYPNPVYNSAYINYQAADKESALILYNSIGEEVRRILLYDKLVRFEKAQLANGVYFYHLLQNSRPVKTGKLILTD